MNDMVELWENAIQKINIDLDKIKDLSIDEMLILKQYFSFIYSIKYKELKEND